MNVKGEDVEPSQDGTAIVWVINGSGKTRTGTIVGKRTQTYSRPQRTA